MIHKTYAKFKHSVMRRCGYECENPHCDAMATTVHHLLKVSRHPELELDDTNGVGLCGPCHSEIERRLRQGENWKELLPYDRLMEVEDGD
jgi:5-methylcytosine-specific restriction endonuclease McrA